MANNITPIKEGCKGSSCYVMEDYVAQEDPGLLSHIKIPHIQRLSFKSSVVAMVLVVLLIASFARKLREVSSEYGFVGRIGGDEFIGIFEKCSEEKVLRFISQLQARVDIFNARGEIVQLSFAFGYASSNDYPLVGVYELLKQADISMYQQKRWMKQGAKA